MTEEHAKKFINFFTETYAVYEKLNDYSILVEKELNAKFPIGHLNEMRSVLFHLYDLSDYQRHHKEDQALENYYNAKDHLHRAYFDVLQILTQHLIDKIHSYHITYTKRSITKVFPKYFTDIAPKVESLQLKIKSIRLKRDKVKDAVEKLKDNDALILQLFDWDITIQSHIPGFVEEELKFVEEDRKAKAIEDRNKMWKTFLLIYVPAFIAIVIFIFVIIQMNKKC